AARIRSGQGGRPPRRVPRPAEHIQTSVRVGCSLDIRCAARDAQHGGRDAHPTRLGLRHFPRSVAVSAAKPNALTVGEFYTRHSEALQMRLLGPAAGFERIIREPTINRPGLALSGFYSYFAHKRIQVLGSAELSYLKSLAKAEVQARV